MQGWARLDAAQRQRFFEAFLKAALRLDALALRAWLRRRLKNPPLAAPIDLARFTISDADMALLLKQLPLRADDADGGTGLWKIIPQTRNASARVQRMDRDPIARPGLRTVALICELLFRCWPETVMAASGDPRRSGWRVRAGQSPLADWAAQISTAAIDRSDTLMPQSVSERVRGCYRVSPPNQCQWGRRKLRRDQ